MVSHYEKNVINTDHDSVARVRNREVLDHPVDSGFRDDRGTVDLDGSRE
jgi:hypothetical protein